MIRIIIIIIKIINVIYIICIIINIDVIIIVYIFENLAILHLNSFIILIIIKFLYQFIFCYLNNMMDEVETLISQKIMQMKT